MRKWRVLHCPTMVGGNPQALSRNLNQLGVNSTSLAFERTVFAFSADRVLWRKEESFVRKEFKRLAAVLKSLWGYDLVHYNFGTTLAAPLYPGKPGLGFLMGLLRRAYSCYGLCLQALELEARRLSGAPMFVHYQGDDARQGDYCLRHFEHTIATEVDDSYYNGSSDEFKRRSIQRISRYCDQVYALNPDLLWVLPKGAKFTPYGHVDLDDWRPVYPREENRPLRIGHAPSNRRAKGTDRILRALDSLKRKGYSFELELVEGVSNDEARRRYETVDVLIDQLYAGWYGGLAVELMALGKPVLVYLREDDLRFIPSGMKEELPFVRVTPDTIEEGLRTVLEMPRSDLLALAKKSRAFVERWHDPLSIAREIKADYEEALRRRGKL